MKKVIILGLSFLCACQSAPQKTEQQSTQSTPTTSSIINEVLPQADYRARIQATDNIQLVDVRTPEEYQAGHIEGALNINFFDPDFEQQLLQGVKKDQPVYLYCRSGNRSGQASKKMVQWGYQEIYDLEGGFSQWKN
ncbi:MAG TPA: rhodanese-like domain-containing protein [Saprospiraceae bacterium]|nr:rhodanese-like domain-containing protein [Saprospiraceae bacterium]HMQ82204.1 rhodanese-like domain-containing protein [Saprospiraceae bacterium]